ncbi:hypothetical protein QTH97_33745 [Variovorax sp. J22R24]|uniref:hypothetical protein n=1 Tax=Variovorax gracilis TaxID=3053502 RepID=UPI002576D02E|nr:hypothetical protein [Variovorax sp. J22R24]MDM0109915.1 hypothetical protein [Variovorax sp. J22R24]
MNPLRFLADALGTAARAIPFLRRTQGEERSKLVADLQAICSRCEDAYAKVLEGLAPIKESYGNRQNLARDLRAFAADRQTREAFKPTHLCAEVDQFMQRLESNVDWLKYSMDLNAIGRVRGAIREMGSFDATLWDYYDRNTLALDQLATTLQSQLSAEDLAERMAYARHAVEIFEEDLRESIVQIRNAKDRVRDLI